MYTRAKYKESPDRPLTDDDFGMIKYDGANYFVPVAEDGSLRFLSRRESVKGDFPDRTESLPHLTDVKVPGFAGSVFNVELIHTGHNKSRIESHSAVSGILNSLPPRAIATQEALGPVRMVIHNVINPQFGTFGSALPHMHQFADALGKPQVAFVAPVVKGPEAITKLVQSTKAAGREGVIVVPSTAPEPATRIKIKHKITHNLRVSRIVQMLDKHGQPKPMMGALVCVDSRGREVADVGTGFSNDQRVEAFLHPDLWLNRHIQVESMGFAKNKLRMPVFNGDADGGLDEVGP
jgi:hypothetical protein